MVFIAKAIHTECLSRPLFSATVLNIRCICNQGQKRKKGQINLTDVAEFLPVSNQQLLTMVQELIRHFIYFFTGISLCASPEQRSNLSGDVWWLLG